MKNSFRDIYEKYTDEKKKKKKNKALKKDFSTNKGSAEGVLDEVYLGNNVYDVKEYMIDLFKAVAQFHIYHLFTRNGTHHEALGVFYTTLQDEADCLSEQLIAHYGNELRDYTSIEDEDEAEEYDDVDEFSVFFGYEYDLCMGDIDDMLEETNEMINLLDKSENKAIVEELTSIQEACNKLLYKMKLDV